MFFDDPTKSDVLLTIPQTHGPDSSHKTCHVAGLCRTHRAFLFHSSWISTCPYVKILYVISFSYWTYMLIFKRTYKREIFFFFIIHRQNLLFYFFVNLAFYHHLLALWPCKVIQSLCLSLLMNKVECYLAKEKSFKVLWQLCCQSTCMQFISTLFQIQIWWASWPCYENGIYFRHHVIFKGVSQTSCITKFVSSLKYTIVNCMLKSEHQYPISLLLNSVQFSSVTQSSPTLCDHMNRSTPGLPVHHQLPEFTQTHVHRVGDAIQPSHPLLSPSPPAPNLSQHQGLFQWVNSSHEVAKVLEFQPQHQSFQWTPRTGFLN